MITILIIIVIIIIMNIFIQGFHKKFAFRIIDLQDEDLLGNLIKSYDNELRLSFLCTCSNLFSTEKGV